MDFEDLTPEFEENARACSSKEELSELAAAMGVKLSDDELTAISGGNSCVKDEECLHYQVIQRCPTDSSCPMQDCTDLAPIECDELFNCSKNNPCGGLKAP